MSSPFAYLLSATRKAEKKARATMNLHLDCGILKDDCNLSEVFEEYFARECKSALREIDLMQRMRDIIAEPFGELITGTKSTPHTYFITIRPDCSKVTFELFKVQVDKLLSRACFKSYDYSYEQKGVTEETLGEGFHVHIVAEMTMRSKSEVLRACLSTFNQWVTNGLIAPNCIEVCITKNGAKIVQDYLIDYKSDDDHKEVTKEWDEKWRTRLSLCPIYSSEIQRLAA